MSLTAKPHATDRAAVRRTVVVANTPAAIFALLADPHQHPDVDGSDSVRSVVEGPDRLVMGSVFRMQMKGYKTTNTVVEFAPDTLIAWRHRGRHVWRWELRAVEGGAEVTETFDYTGKRGRALVEFIGVPKRAGVALEQTLQKLQARFA